MTVKYSEFVHLHNHSEYSFLDGAIKIKDMVKKAVEQNAPAIALTDHGGLFGSMEFFFACKGEGIKPILGFEAYITPQSRKIKDKNRNHLILLAENNKGWQNIMKLSSIGYTEGFYYRPRIDFEVLRAHSEGIIATSACIGGEIQQAILAGRRDEALQITDKYLEIFGENNFFLELQDHGMDDEKIIMEQLIDIGRTKGVPMIVANDAHYLEASDAEAHDVLLCMQTNAKLKDANRYQFPTDQFYLKTPEEMAELFPSVPEAMTNTVAIAERCNVDPVNKAQMPSPGVPQEGMTEAEYLRDLAYEGAKKLYGDPIPADAQERLDYELSVIIDMGFPGYYLIVRDFLMEADRLGIMRGVRGSAAGSLVGYVIGISNVCPLKFDLIFERFLNPERNSMPDVDADLADADREKVITYCVNKYGREAVSQIINFGRMMAKAAIKDVARVMDVPVSDAQMLSNMVEEKTIQKSINANGELKTLLENNSLFRQVVAYAQKLEGMARQPGMHACGVIIAPGDISNWAPLFKPAGEGAPVMTQFDMGYVEQSGMIKMDFLGLRTLTVLQNTVRMVKENHGVEYDIWRDIKDGDDKTYKEIFHKGETVEIFQFESPGMRKYLRKLQPTVIEDLIAMTSLYRPGPMENIDSFIKRKHGIEPIVYPHPMLSSILDVTYGIIIYQEQVMRIAQMMGGFTLGMADTLRKAMGKKKLDLMEKMKVKFMEGAKEKDIDLKAADQVWALMAKFAEYGFNKAHACVYAHVSYQSAFFKAHYPVEYMAAVMTSRMGSNDKFVTATEEAKRLGIEVLPPNINKSRIDCDVHENKITIGLGAIANVGKAAIEILNVRDKEGVFEDIFDLCCKVNLREVSKKALESLIYAGAFDDFPGTRAANVEAIEGAVDFGKKQQAEAASGQMNLFGDASVALPKPTIPDVMEWDHFEKLNREKMVMNFYVSGHPLEAFKDEVEGFSTLSFSEEGIKAARKGQSVVIGGVITSVKKFNSKRDGRTMAFMGFEDFYGQGELFCPPNNFETLSHLCQQEKMVLVRGKVEKEIEHSNEGEEGRLKCKVIVDKILPLEEARNTLTKSVHINVTTSGLESSHIEAVKEVCEESKGSCNVVIHLHTETGNEYKVRSKGLKTSCDKEFFGKLLACSGVDNVTLSQRAS